MIWRCSLFERILLLLRRSRDSGDNNRRATQHDSWRLLYSSCRWKSIWNVNDEWKSELTRCGQRLSAICNKKSHSDYLWRQIRCRFPVEYLIMSESRQYEAIYWCSPLSSPWQQCLTLSISSLLLDRELRSSIQIKNFTWLAATFKKESYEWKEIECRTALDRSESSNEKTIRWTCRRIKILESLL